jgi:hypothetical protein
MAERAEAGSHGHPEDRRARCLPKWTHARMRACEEPSPIARSARNRGLRGSAGGARGSSRAAAARAGRDASSLDIERDAASDLHRRGRKTRTARGRRGSNALRARHHLCRHQQRAPGHLGGRDATLVGTIYVPDSEGLFALSPSGSSTFSALGLNGVSSWAVIGQEGTIYIMDSSGTLYALGP